MNEAVIIIESLLILVVGKRMEKGKVSKVKKSGITRWVTYSRMEK